MATLCAGQLDADRPVPHLSHLVESYNVDQPAYAAAMPVAAVEHVQYILQENLGLPTNIAPNVRGALGDYWQKTRDCAPGAGRRVPHNWPTSIEKTASAPAKWWSPTCTASSSSTPPSSLACASATASAKVSLETPYGRAALAAQALKVGLSRVVSVTLANGLDTHDNTWANDHSTMLVTGFNAFARLLKDLRDSEAPGGGSMLDKTTLVCLQRVQAHPPASTSATAATTPLGV